MVNEEELKYYVSERVKKWSSSKEHSEWTDDEILKFVAENRDFIKKLDISLISYEIDKDTKKDISKLQKALINGKYKFSALKKLICKIHREIYYGLLWFERMEDF